MPGLLDRLFGGPANRDPQADPARLARHGEAVRTRLEGEFGHRNRGGRKAQLYVIRDFVSPRDCAGLIRLIDGELGPSTLFGDGGGARALRTSSTHYFAEAQADARRLAERIDVRLGLERAHAETMQGQRYLPGEQYRAHCDFFRVERDHWQTERRRGGQRTWTAMIYLNAVEAGGATDFLQLGVTIQPEPGTMVVWNNLTRRGLPNRATIHAGMPVKAGRKYIVTQWYRLDAWTRQVR